MVDDIMVNSHHMYSGWWRYPVPHDSGGISKLLQKHAQELRPPIRWRISCMKAHLFSYFNTPFLDYYRSFRSGLQIYLMLRHLDLAMCPRTDMQTFDAVSSLILSSMLPLLKVLLLINAKYCRIQMTRQESSSSIFLELTDQTSFMPTS